MKECHCVIACTVRERGPARGNRVKKKKKKRVRRGAPGSCSAPGLSLGM